MLVSALGIYKSPLTFDRVVLVEMFETDLDNAHMSSGANPFTALCTSCDCLSVTRSGSGSQFNGFNSESLGALYSQSVITRRVFVVCKCALVSFHFPRVCYSSPCVVERSGCMKGTCLIWKVFFYPAQKCEFSGNRVVCLLYMGILGEESIHLKPK